MRKRDGKGILEGPRRGWENIIKIDLNEVGWEGVLDSCGCREGQAVGCCEWDNEMPGSLKCG